MHLEESGNSLRKDVEYFYPKDLVHIGMTISGVRAIFEPTKREVMVGLDFGTPHNGICMIYGIVQL